MDGSWRDGGIENGKGGMGRERPGED